MRIECENCSATYTIDDAQLGDQPIGAQCPYCGHVKVVQRVTSAPASELGFGTGDADLGFRPTTPEPDSEFGFGPGGGPPRPPTASLDLGSGFDLDAPTSASEGSGQRAARTSAPASFGQDELQLGSTLPTQPAMQRNSADIDFSVGTSAGVDAGAVGVSDSSAFCQECGRALVDEFDKVIGLCELHQQERRSEGFGGAPSPGSTAWFVLMPTGVQAGPLGLEELRDQLRGGEVPLASQFSTDGQRFQPLSAFKELAYLASLGVGGQAGIGQRASYAPVARGFHLGRLVTPVIVILLLAGFSYFAWVKRADLMRLYQGVIADSGPDGPGRTNPLRRYLASWRLAHPDVSGTASEHLLAADDLHLEDTWSGYERAERAYQRALLLDENNPEAIAGYVENLAIWRYALASPQEVTVARTALEYAMELDPESGPVRRAVGALALVSGDLNGCRAGAVAALERARTDSRARLILAGCYVDGNVQLAVREAELAKRGRPALRRADRVLAAAYRRSGRYQSAYAVLDQRLKSDPRNGAVHLAYGHLEAALARYPEAEARYRRAAGLEGDKQAALLALGQLALEQRQSERSIDFFRRAASANPPTGRRGADLYADWARAELGRRSFARAEKLAEQALKFSPKHVPALLVMAEAALLSGSSTTARTYVRRARKERGDEPAALILEGRVDIAEGGIDAGLHKMRTAVKNDPKDARLHGVLAGAYLYADRDAQAYATMRRAVDLDPARAHAVHRNTELTVSESAVRDAIRRFERSAREPRNTSVAYAAIALLDYHLGDLRQASRMVTRALSVDDANVLALIYEAQIGLDLDDIDRAERAANKLLLVERGSALGHLLRARVAVRREEVEAARENFRSALRTNPGLLAAEVELAALELDSGQTENEARARATLDRAFTIEPDLLDLRKVLQRHKP